MTFEILFLIILFTHWVADFVTQSDAIAKGKSEDLELLFKHALGYSIIWVPVIIGMILFGMSLMLLWFPLLMFITHIVIDYYTSKVHSQLYAKGDIHNFFVSVGFDQVLHYLTIFYSFKLLLS
jgi:hypothetical protein